MNRTDCDFDATSDEEEECVEISVSKFQAIYDAILSGERFIDEQVNLIEELQAALKETYTEKLKLEAENDKLKWKLRAYVPATPIYNFFKKMKKVADFQEMHVRSLSNWCKKFRNGCKQQSLQIKKLKMENSEVKKKMEASEKRAEELEKEKESMAAAFLSSKRSAMGKIKELEEKLEATTLNTRTAVDWFSNENAVNTTIDLIGDEDDEIKTLNFTPAAPGRAINEETNNFSFSRTPFAQQKPSQPFRTPRFIGDSTVRSNRTSINLPSTVRSRMSNFPRTPLEDGVPVFKSARTIENTTRNSSGWDPSREFREGTTSRTSTPLKAAPQRLPVNLDAQIQGNKPLLLATVNKSSSTKSSGPMMPGSIGKQRIVPNFLRNLQ